MWKQLTADASKGSNRENGLIVQEIQCFTQIIHRCIHRTISFLHSIGKITDQTLFNSAEVETFEFSPC